MNERTCMYVFVHLVVHSLYIQYLTEVSTPLTFL